MSEIRMTPTEWAQIDGLEILDPDGWRKDGKDFTEPITQREYMERMVQSTVQGLVPAPAEEGSLMHATCPKCGNQRPAPNECPTCAPAEDGPREWCCRFCGRKTEGNMWRFGFLACEECHTHGPPAPAVERPSEEDFVTAGNALTYGRPLRPAERTALSLMIAAAREAERLRELLENWKQFYKNPGAPGQFAAENIALRERVAALEAVLREIENMVEREADEGDGYNGNLAFRVWTASREALAAGKEPPFGFTWEDVDALDTEASVLSDDEDADPFTYQAAGRLQSIRDRIAALLPPREAGKETE